MPSRTTRGRWTVESGRMMLAVPYAHAIEDSVIRHMFIGPGARRRAQRWLAERMDA